MPRLAPNLKCTHEDGLVDGPCDLIFKLYDAAGSGTPPTGGTLLGTKEKPDHDVVEGLFTVQLDFGSGVFTGDPRWLQIEVDCGDGPVTLSPRQRLTAAPYALHADLLDGRHGSFYRDATNLNVGTLSTDRYSAYSDLGAENRLNNDTGTDLLTRDQADGRYWRLGGNSGTDPTTDFLGTTDEVSLTLAVSGTAALRIEPASWEPPIGDVFFYSPNIIGGFSGNSVTPGAVGATISGGGWVGGSNRAGMFDTVGGGTANTADGGSATVGGGQGNAASGVYATVGGGVNNDIGSVGRATIGGGEENVISWPAFHATIGGGHGNTASGEGGTVSGGWSNTASNVYATVGGGDHNTADNNYATVAGGHYNVASGWVATVGGGANNEASGSYAAVPGGAYNVAEGNYSFAAGRRAKANHDGAFVWADSLDYNFASTAVNQWSARATGGARFVLAVDGSGNPTYTCYVNNGDPSWTCSSDRNLKHDLLQVDGAALLETLAEMPVYYWSPLGSETRHIGPMAQDFATSFAVGSSDIAISTIDLDGVALAAIQGLHARNEELEAENAELRARLDTMETKTATQQAQIDSLSARLEAMEQALNSVEGTEAARHNSPNPLQRTVLPGAGMLVVAVAVAWGARRKGGMR